MIEANVVIIGAGPVGLFQAYYLGLQGIPNVHVIDILDRPGGQCAELYPTKPIFDIPAVPDITGDELTQNLLKQLSPFPPTFHYNEQVLKVDNLFDPERADDADAGYDGHLVTTQSGLTFHAKAVVVATGMGSFVPNKLTCPGASGLEQMGMLRYAIREQAESFRNRDVIILGGGDSALDWALALQPHASSVTIVHRTATFRAHKHTAHLVQQLEAQQNLAVLTGQVIEVGATDQDHNFIKVMVKDGLGVTRRLSCDDLLCFYGLAPKLGPVADWGLQIDRNRITVDPEKFETSVAGVFAVGDACYYPGKQKLILSGYHEAALAAYKIVEYVTGKKAMFAYTTTSPIMHKRLGISLTMDA